MVYKAINKESGAERAVKKIEKSKWCPEENQKILDEFNVLKGLDHPNILKMYELFEEDSHFYIVTDICKGGDLLDELEELEGDTGAFPERDAAILMNQVLSSINYCHKNNFVHRDLKPENILLEQNKALHEIKLIDFGFAVPCDETTTMSEQKGTAAYMSPQAMLELPYGQKADVWAVGVIAYIVLAGFNPFEGHTDPETAVLVEMGEFELDIPEWEEISVEAKDFVTKCLAYEEKDRLSAAEALEHPWIRNCRSKMHSDFYKNDSINCELAMNNLQKFHAQSKLKQATCTYIASQLVSKDEKETIDKLFRSMDTDSDGKLRKQEVKVGYKSIFGKDLSDEDVDDLYAHVDMNGDGIIEYSEFAVAAINEDILLRDENLKKAFSFFDKDKDGFISRGDLVKVMASFGGKSVDGSIIDKIMNQIDTDDSGRIDFDEFRASMFSTADLTEEEPDEEELPLDQPLKDSDSASGASLGSKKLNSKPAMMMPRRRSSAAEDMVKAVMNSKDGGREIFRSISGSSTLSNLSNMTGASGDDAGSGDGVAPPLGRTVTPPPSSVKVKPGASPVRAVRAKKGITRTKSGFMTQRAEPVNLQVRKCKKPATAPVVTKKKAAPPKKKEHKVKRTKSDDTNSSSSSSSSSSSGSSSSSSSSEEGAKKKAAAKKKKTPAASTATPAKSTPSPRPSPPAPVAKKTPASPVVKKKPVPSPRPSPPTPVAKKKPVSPTPAPAPAPPPMLEKKASYTTRTSVTAKTVTKVPVSPPEIKKNGTDESVTDAIEMIKKMKKEAKKPKESKPKKSGGGGGLGDMLGALPSSKKFKKQQKKANPMSSTMSVPAVPTQASIRQRNSVLPTPVPAMEEAPSSPIANSPMEDDSSNSHNSAAKRSSTKGPSSSIKNRMSMFGGKGGGGQSFPSDSRFKPPSFTKRNSYTKRTSETKSPSMKPNTIAAALKRTSNGTSSRKLMEDDSYKNSSTDPMSQSDKSHERTTDKDLMAGMMQRPVRRNSFDGKKPGGRTSLRDRMKLFEQNIQKNHDKGQVKKIY